jgi:uncharacterized protein YcnI
MRKISCAFSLLLLTTFTQAHVVLLEPAAAAGSSYRAAFRVGHGCGSEATLALQVHVPEGFNAAQPMPKPGWTLSAQSGPLAQPYTLHGKTYAEGVKVITWTANGAENALPSAFYDEFVLRGNTPKQPGPLWFKVLQKCAGSSLEWTQVPASGTSTHGLESPAALLDVLDVQAGQNHNH